MSSNVSEDRCKLTSFASYWLSLSLLSKEGLLKIGFFYNRQRHFPKKEEPRFGDASPEKSLGSSSIRVKENPYQTDLRPCDRLQA